MIFSPIIATTFADDESVLNNADAPLIAAWGRHNRARAIYDSLPRFNLPSEDYTPEELALLEIIDATELEIRATKASTCRGVEIQLWLSLSHLIADSDGFSAGTREDFSWFDQCDERLDWIERLIVSAIRSLRAMGERPSSDDFAAMLRAWEDARAAREAFDEANRPNDAPGLTPEMELFEELLVPFHDACLVTATALIKCPAPDAAAVIQKQRVFYAEEMHQCQGTEVGVIESIFADAVRLAGGVA